MYGSSASLSLPRSLFFCVVCASENKQFIVSPGQAGWEAVEQYGEKLAIDGDGNTGFMSLRET